jgi:hypothetical protein
MKKINATAKTTLKGCFYFRIYYIILKNQIFLENHLTKRKKRCIMAQTDEEEE